MIRYENALAMILRLTLFNSTSQISRVLNVLNENEEQAFAFVAVTTILIILLVCLQGLRARQTNE